MVNSHIIYVLLEIIFIVISHIFLHIVRAKFFFIVFFSHNLYNTHLLLCSGLIIFFLPTAHWKQELCVLKHHRYNDQLILQFTCNRYQQFHNIYYLFKCETNISV